MDSHLAAFNANLEYFSTGDISALKTFCDIKFLGTAIFGEKNILIYYAGPYLYGGK